MPAKPKTEDGWTQVSEDEVEETKIVIDTLGDQFTGTYLGMRSVNSDDGGYQQARFAGTDGGIYFINANHSLSQGLKDVRPGTMTRFTFYDEKDTGQKSPMRVFRVETRK